MIIFALVLFILSFLVLTGMFLVKLAEVDRSAGTRKSGTIIRSEDLWHYFKQKFSALLKKIWHFILEAKDLTPATTRTMVDQYEKVKSAFRIRIRSSEKDPHWLPEAKELVIKPAKNPEELYLEAIKKNPDDVSAYEALGRLYLQNKNFTDAVEIYEHLIKLEPNKDVYFSNLGLARYSLKDYPNAAVAYEKAINLNSKVPTRWINLGLCFQAREEYHKAVKAFLQALELDKMNPNYLALLADVYLKLNNNVRAEEVLEQILAIEPMNRMAREKLMRLRI